MESQLSMSSWNQALQWSLFLLLWIMQVVFCIQKKNQKKMQKKWVSKKSILFSLVDYVHNRKEPGRRIFLLIIRLVWPVPAWSGTLGSDAICRAPSGNPVQLRALPSQPIGCSKCSDLENEKIIFVFKKSDIFYMRPATWSNAIWSWRASVINKPLCMCALVLRFVGV